MARRAGRRRVDDRKPARARRAPPAQGPLAGRSFRGRRPDPAKPLPSPFQRRAQLVPPRPSRRLARALRRAHATTGRRARRGRLHRRPQTVRSSLRIQVVMTTPAWCASASRASAPRRDDLCAIDRAEIDTRTTCSAIDTQSLLKRALTRTSPGRSDRAQRSRWSGSPPPD